MIHMFSNITVRKLEVIQRSCPAKGRNLRAFISTFRQSSRPEAHNTGASQKISNFKNLKFFASTLPGLEKLVYNEFLSIGVEGIKVNPNDAMIGGVQFRVSCLEDVMKCHLHLGAVSHIYLRASDPFVATGMEELVRKVANMDFWPRYLYSRNGSLPLLDIRVTASKSRLFHTKGIAERVERGILTAMKIDCEAYASKKELSDTNAEKLRILVRIVQNQVEISVDTACTPLHRRGYRLQTGKAPLREDLAFAFLRTQGWCWNSAFDGLIDPMCGSGTLLIEGASMASGLPPGRLRPPPFKHSQLWDGALWKDVVDSTLSQANAYTDSQKCPVIIGSDRDKGVIGAATENIKRAGLEDMIELHNCSISDNPWFTNSASYKLQNMLLVTNPPYGVRVSPSKKMQKRKIHPLLSLYQTLGRCSNGTSPRANFGIIANDVNLARQTGVENLTSLFTTLHGGLSVTALSTIRKPSFSTSLALKR
jgi:putative N6-adenine-specific DNA methylase